MVIATYSLTALDCQDPIVLADFYSQITGWPINEERTWRDESEIVKWTQLMSEVGATIGFQHVANYRAPTWPEGDFPQQEHLDFDVDDLDVGEVEVLNIGARKANHQPGDGFRVFFDPAGHPFCLVKRSN
jgi:hypothetical protein